MARVCIVCPHHISSQPRSLREADTLSERGHEVMVVSRQTDPARTLEDRLVAAERSWQLRAVELHRTGRSRARWLRTAARSEVARRMLHVGLGSVGVAVESVIRGAPALTRLALEWPADLYIGHTQLGLPAAAIAAEAHGARLAFDCEDLLAESGTDDPAAIRAIESAFIGRCDYVTAASPAMADRLESQYGIQAHVLYNVFPLRLRGDMPVPHERPRSEALRLHWFGQTLGPGRGIEEAVAAVRELRQGFELHLRGRIRSEYRERLVDIGGEAAPMFFHEPLPHDDLIRSLDQFDVGLALEDSAHPNAGITVSNKLFSYVLGGLAVLATDTEGQREALRHMPHAGSLLPDLRSETLARASQAWRNDPGALISAQSAAWEAASTRFCWDVESGRFVELVERALATRIPCLAEVAV